MKQIIIRLILLMLITKFSIVMADERLDVNNIINPSTSLTAYLGLLEDSSQKLTFADIQQENVKILFKTNLPPQESINLSYTSSAYWLRLIIENSSDLTIEKIIELNHPLLKNVDFYWQIDHKDHQTIHTGYALPFENRAYKSNIFAFPVQFPAHSHNVIYLRVASPNAMFIMANLWEPMAFQQRERNGYAFQALYFGIVIAISLFSLGLAIATKETIFFIYFCMVFLIACGFLANKGLGAEFIWPNCPWLTQRGSLGFGAFTLSAILLFIRGILSTQKQMPKVDWMIKALIGLLLMMVLLLLLTFALAKFTMVLFAVIAIFMLIPITIGLMQKQRAAYFLAIGFSLLAIGVIIRALYALGLIQGSYYSLNGIQIGSAFELLMFTLLLTDGYRSIQQEKLRGEVLIKHTQDQLLAKTEDHKAAVNHQLALTNQVYQMQKLENMSRLTSGIAHDFNNILGAMVGYNDLNTLAAETCPDPSLKDELLFNTQQIDTASQHALELIKKMLAYSRQQPLDKAIDLRPSHEVIDELLIILRPGLTTSFQINTDIDLDVTIQIDATHLGQILTNLLVNARDAMKDQMGAISISLKKITVHEAICNSCAQTLEGDFIELRIADNGIGMEENIIKHIFDPFFTTKDLDKGTGLGLSIVSTMVHDSEGHIVVESNTSQMHQGTTFRLLFPLNLNRGN